MPHDENTPYEVGYKRPPKHSQFQPGQSGNRRGRPQKKMHFASTFREKLMRSVPVKKNGRIRHMTVVEALAERMVAAALQGTQKDMILILQAIERYAPDQLRTLPKDLCMRVRYVAPTEPGALPPPPRHLLPPDFDEEE